ncbi:DUF6233 domain-containing protein [Streptomyces sp. SCL15-6]|uniref:DUF6233 domain-containing protein n=1 Tax=Streptomyces sp. SCL15-6 TaxID=2967222 RepID=UPI002965D067|nr:DUF6233 domain-containing protein [Streptomyces sp. SCL15-6]
MADLPPDLPRLRTLEAYLVLLLGEVRAATTLVEKREAERQRGLQDRPLPPDWLLEQGLNRDGPPVQVHCGDCWNKGKRTRRLSLDKARHALTEGVKACGVCRPDSALGFLES